MERSDHNVVEAVAVDVAGPADLGADTSFRVDAVDHKAGRAVAATRGQEARKLEGMRERQQYALLERLGHQGAVRPPGALPANSRPHRADQGPARTQVKSTTLIPTRGCG